MKMSEKFDFLIDDKVIEKFNLVEDSSMKNAIFNYCSKVGLSKTRVNLLYGFLSLYKNIKLDSLTWENLCDITTEVESKNSLKHHTMFNLDFIRYLIENGLYKGSNAQIVYEITKYCTTKKQRSILFNKNVKLENLIICEYKKHNGLSYDLIDTKLNNKFLVELLDGFYKSDLFSKAYHNFDFARNFVDSYSGFSDFKDITDFNYQIFNKQFDFYKDKKTEVKELVKFYIYLHSLHDGIFKPTDPVDIVWLNRPTFIEEFKEGFRIIDINHLEDVPDGDKWILRPNGLEQFTTEMKSTNYKKIDFSKVDYKEYRPFAKDFYWYSKQVLPVRRAHFYMLVSFLNFIYKYKNMSINKNDIDYMTITTKEVISYLSYIKNTDSVSTVNSKVSCVKAFLNEDYFDYVSPSVFNYLTLNGDSPAPGGISIPDDELKKLDKHLLELAEESEDSIFYIYYAIFRIALDTNLRISYILSITLDSIKEGMKEGQYYIEAITKTSNKEKVKENISKYAHRYLNIAKEKTEELRKDASEEYEKYVFLRYEKCSRIKQAQPISKNGFNKFLKKQCKAIGIPQYTAANLRDTSITQALDFARENNLSYAETKALVRGNPSTKIKHYFDENESKLFVEATYGIIIGDIDIKGQILENTDSSSFSKEETVDDDCGFCKEEECRILEDIGCPMCNFFMVTLDRIPFYERKIEQLKKAIENETIEHEREHLKAIERLYAAYLVALYEYKEKLGLK